MLKTSEILKNFIKEIENLVDKKVKIIRCDNGTEFKNKVMDDFCREKGIRREYSVARTPQQNGVAERRNRTLIEAARTCLVTLSLPTLIGQKQFIYGNNPSTSLKNTIHQRDGTDQVLLHQPFTAMKIPIIKKGEYDIWSMRMRQYICHTDHNLWDIIVNGDLEDEATPSGEQSSPPVPKTAKQLDC
ncbi:putative ribonuclease H-like domain-containing protein [Tanacetum coccineum]